MYDAVARAPGAAQSVSRSGTSDNVRESKMTMSMIRELLWESDGVVSMEFEGESPIRLRVELTSEAAAALFSSKVQLLGGRVLSIKGSLVIVGEED
jgi:hypothetical protein